MNGFLLDTNVISEVFKPRASPAVLKFFDSANPETLYLSVITWGELRHGAYRWGVRHPGQVNKLEAWTQTVEAKYGTRLLGLTAEIADRWAWFRADRDRPEIDTLLAATASVHGLTMVTRNVKDFLGLDLPLLNPWDG